MPAVDRDRVLPLALALLAVVALALAAATLDSAIVADDAGPGGDGSGVGGLLFVGLFAVVYRSTWSTAAGTAVCGAVGLPVGLL